MSGAPSPFVLAYDDLMRESFGHYLKLSATIGGLVKGQSEVVQALVQAQRQFLVVASTSRQPTNDVLAQLLKPMSDLIQQVQDIRNKNRSNEFFNHLSAISESIPAIGWVAVAPAPGPYVKEMNDASQFYTNKVLVAYKDKDKTHIEWAKTWLAFLTELQAYIKQYHTTGLTWSQTGAPATTQNGASVGSAAPAPPPPPPPFGFFDDVAKADAGRGALLKELNQGTDITKGLRKVTSDQMTHKNPAIRTTGPTPYKAPAVSKPAAPTAPIRGPAKFALEGKKWEVEYQIGQQQLVIDKTEMNQSVSVYKCEDSVLIVKGKVNSITVNSCKKFAIVFDNIVSVVEFINSQRIKAQAMSKVPTIAIDKTDGVEIYLSKDSLDVELITSKCSELNVSVPDQKTGDFVEHAIPEQLKTVWTGKGFKTVALDMA